MARLQQKNMGSERGNIVLKDALERDILEIENNYKMDAATKAAYRRAIIEPTAAALADPIMSMLFINKPEKRKAFVSNLHLTWRESEDFLGMDMGRRGVAADGGAAMFDELSTMGPPNPRQGLMPQ